ncbi:MAG: Nif3-like dinuclear metal center hexameric protein [Calditrichia bacterium]
MEREKLINAVDEYLESDSFSDFGPNGLQVEGRESVQKIITGVTASLALIEKAIEKNADMILVHHGILWSGQNPVLKGSFKRRIKLLLDHNINLVAYHLPLDAHPEVGNNIQIAKRLQLENIQPFGAHKNKTIGFAGNTGQPVPINRLVKQLETILDKKVIHFNYGQQTVRNIAIVSGGAQKYLEEAVDGKFDVFITGEVSEFNYHLSAEEGIHFISAGHHATERFGIQALGEWISANCGLDTEFVDIPNPI